MTVTYKSSNNSNTIVEADVRTTAYNAVVNAGYTFNSWSGSFSFPGATTNTNDIPAVDSGLRITAYNSANQLVTFNVYAAYTHIA